MSGLKIFSKAEKVSLITIFLILTVVAIPNFLASLRRARDQVRRDDLGALMAVLDKYKIDFGVYPLSSNDGKIMNCLKPGDSPYKDEKGYWVVNPIPCEWGKDAFLNLIDNKEYASILPQDPGWQKGASYHYLSDGARYQIFASMEGKDEPEVDPVIILENLGCGTRICNVGRFVNCEIPKSLETCQLEDAEKLLQK